MGEFNTGKPIIITGLSGAGISSVLKAMEDFKFEVFDNFPLSFIPSLYEQTANEPARIAIGVDTRTRGFSPDAVLEIVAQMDARLVFMTCEDAVLQRRFTETRRRHPLARDKSLSYGVRQERKLLEPLLFSADIVIDTTDTSVHDLRHILEGHFAPHPDEKLTISLISFGFRHGVPREADIVMDVRFLRNPHWDKALKAKTGLEDDVGLYIREDSDFEGFIEGFKTMLKPLLPRYTREGKSYLTVAIGCTGGKHRSVFTVETLKAWFKEQGLHVYVEHRDIPQ